MNFGQCGSLPVGYQCSNIKLSSTVLLFIYFFPTALIKAVVFPPLN